MQKSVRVTDRTLRLLVGALLLGVAAGTYTEYLSILVSLLLSALLVGAVLISAVSLLTHPSR